MKKVEKITLTLEIDQNIAADFQAMLDEINAHNKEHMESSPGCKIAPYDLNNSVELHMRQSLARYHTDRVIEKFLGEEKEDGGK